MVWVSTKWKKKQSRGLKANLLAVKWDDAQAFQNSAAASSFEVFSTFKLLKSWNFKLSWCSIASVTTSYSNVNIITS